MMESENDLLSPPSPDMFGKVPAMPLLLWYWNHFFKIVPVIQRDVCCKVSSIERIANLLEDGVIEGDDKEDVTAMLDSVLQALVFTVLPSDSGEIETPPRDRQMALGAKWICVLSPASTLAIIFRFPYGTRRLPEVRSASFRCTYSRTEKRKTGLSATRVRSVESWARLKLAHSNHKWTYTLHMLGCVDAVFRGNRDKVKR